MGRTARLEARELVAMARGAPPDSAPVEAGMDWSVFGDLAVRHQVAALCWLVGSGTAGDHGSCGRRRPAAATERLRRAFEEHRARNLRLANELRAIHRAVGSAGLHVLVFKGPWLAWHAYPHFATRPIYDIDLGVREADYRRLTEVLSWLDYMPLRLHRRRVRFVSLPAEGRTAARRSHYRQQLRFYAEDKVPVEIHFRMINVGRLRSEEEAVWRGARTVHIDSDLAIAVPGPEHMLAHLLVHANQHAFAALRHLHDIRWAIHRDAHRIDWEGLGAILRSLGLTSSAYHSLVLARDLAGADVPGEVLNALRPSIVRRTIFRTLWRDASVRRLDRHPRRRMFEATLFSLLEVGTPTDRLVYAAHVARERFASFTRRDGVRPTL